MIQSHLSDRMLSLFKKNIVLLLSGLKKVNGIFEWGNFFMTQGAWFWLQTSVLYTSDSQPGVRVPLGVRKHTAWGTWKHLIITCVTLYFLRIINMGVLMVWQIGSGGTQDKKGWETLLYTDWLRYAP